MESSRRKGRQVAASAPEMFISLLITVFWIQQWCGVPDPHLAVHMPLALHTVNLLQYSRNSYAYVRFSYDATLNHTD